MTKKEEYVDSLKQNPIAQVANIIFVSISQVSYQTSNIVSNWQLSLSQAIIVVAFITWNISNSRIIYQIVCHSWYANCAKIDDSRNISYFKKALHTQPSDEEDEKK